MIYFFAIFVLLFIIELVYFKIADRFQIIDQPNHRSSHTRITIRGGGIIFPVAVLVYTLTNYFPGVYFVIGLLAISTVSFLDDVLTLNNKVRLGVHLSSVLLLFFQWDLFSFSWYWLFGILIFIIATINAYNFMDGINGITGGYSLLAVATLYYINTYVVDFISSTFLIVVGLSLMVFNFFNFRTKARCFAGDVGSVSMAFILIFAVGSLIIKTQNFAYVLLLLIYGLDTLSTILFRLLRKERIFEAHRTHFYQFLTNDKGMSHLQVSLIYVTLQLLFNMAIIWKVPKTIDVVFLISIAMGFLFIGLRYGLEGRKRILGGL